MLVVIIVARFVPPYSTDDLWKIFLLGADRYYECGYSVERRRNNENNVEGHLRL